MKIIIPMTGYGSRFVSAGYEKLKPFIDVQGMPIIEWIVKGMYKEENDFLFICRKEHLDTLPYIRETLERIAPEGKIVQIYDWIKKGPVYDVLRANEYIDDDEPCIINYCDFYMDWDYKEFAADVEKRGCEGSVPCYTGFHPHLLIKKNLYASCKVDENGDLIEICEKYSFEQDKTKALHSPGVYYFKSGNLMKKYCRELVESGLSINGEYYASLPYNYMVNDGLKVWVPANVRSFCQWGTPEDMQDQQFWMNCILSWK